MKISKRDAQILMAFLGIVIAFCAYQFGAKPLTAKADEYKAESEVLQKEVLRLEGIQKNLPVYEEETAAMEVFNSGVISRFPSMIYPEDIVMLADTLETVTDYTYIRNIGMGNLELLYTTGQTAAAPEGDGTAAADMTAAAGGTVPQYMLYRMPVNYSVDISYKGMKDFLNYLYSRADRESVDTISIAYDMTTGILSGTFGTSIYCVLGTDRPYQPSTIPQIRMQTENIFNTLEVQEHDLQNAQNGDEDAENGDTQEAEE